MKLDGKRPSSGRRDFECWVYSQKAGAARVPAIVRPLPRGRPALPLIATGDLAFRAEGRMVSQGIQVNVLFVIQPSGGERYLST